MRRILLLTLAVLTVFLSACAPAAGETILEVVPAEGFAFEEDMAMEEPMAPTGGEARDGIEFDAQDVGDNVAQQQERLIIRTGNISISSDDTRATRVEIEDLVAQYVGQGAFIVSVNESGGAGDEQPRINMQIRIPSQEFDTVMDAIAEMGVDVFDRNESGQDVTEEFVDLQARLESLEAARDRLLEIVEEAETTEALLQAEEQLTRREEEIESIKGRLQFLQQSARLSSISITIQPTRLSQPVDTAWRPAETFREAIDRLVNGIRDFADFLIIFVVSVLPWLVLVGAVGYGIVRFFIWLINQLTKRRQQQKAAEIPKPENP